MGLGLGARVRVGCRWTCRSSARLIVMSFLCGNLVLALKRSLSLLFLVPSAAASASASASSAASSVPIRIPMACG